MTTQNKRLDGRVAVVTGASRGIGRAVALRYAQEGAHVIACARTTGALEELDDAIAAVGGSATLAPFDITDFPAIDRLGEAIHGRWKKLDILVGNAGMLGTLTPMGHMKPDEWDDVLKVNLTANWRLLRSLDPLLRQSDAGRAIFVTSTVGHQPRAFWSAYAVSKAGLEMMARTYAQEMEKSTVRTNLINPGATRTTMRIEAMPGEDPKTVKSPESITEAFVELAEPTCTRNGDLIEL
ncbi:SDR family NAD(P)-dependent oxidoreductase [Varunaivibrio sulfuroxidans]|uniref:NAD(P)-dependent dehydrogenase (Short-subunit alcohol dehydrogenase family) n=1 Tax=Varunaivibrio sulfuroxidans TaxID=1773489 RepID=A0A4V2UN28_9PROT|nr:SDR family NAD(P)-dependent oxidoreductase [Varunaivibrio sulfuroxidans]TCS60141.1 NAD(P)-dependent dehydrogenase (short-subunit alcohol dehydrogenase family) [Varunaivibrio sulfuroxidans]WES30887.1 SDR family NAD(P)-dependent oxidoreductase [Varunaivibrio sulfuroxidans]